MKSRTIVIIISTAIFACLLIIVADQITTKRAFDSEKNLRLDISEKRHSFEHWIQDIQSKFSNQYKLIGIDPVIDTSKIYISSFTAEIKKDDSGYYIKEMRIGVAISTDKGEYEQDFQFNTNSILSFTHKNAEEEFNHTRISLSSFAKKLDGMDFAYFMSLLPELDTYFITYFRTDQIFNEGYIIHNDGSIQNSSMVEDLNIRHIVTVIMLESVEKCKDSEFFDHPADNKVTIFLDN